MRNLSSILILALLGLCFSSEVLSQTVVKYQDYASRGNVSATIQGQSSAQKFPQVFPGATVTVYATGTTNLSTIYSNTGLTTKANPFTATSEGYFEFYAIPGTYDIRFSGTGISVPFTRSGVEIQIGSANILGGTIDYIQKKASSSAIGNSLLYEQGGAVRAPTASITTNTTQIATTAFTQQMKGKHRIYTISTLPTSTYADGTAIQDGDVVYVTDGNRAPRVWRSALNAWVDEDGGQFNVMRFSADNTGATNTQAAIQATIDAAATAGVLDVYVPAGTYKLTRATDGSYNYGLKITNNIRLRGDGAATVFSVDSAAVTRFVPILVQPTSTVAYVEFRDFVIDGNGKGQLDAGLMQVNSAVRIVVDGVELKEGGTAAEASPQGVNGIAISSASSGTTQQITLNRLYIHDTTKAAINISTNAANVEITGARIKDITGNGQSPGIQINGASVVTIDRAIVSATEGPGIVISTVGTPPSHTDSNNIVIANSFVYGCGTGSVTGEGIKLQNANSTSALMDSRVLITGCQIYGNGVGVAGSGIRAEYQKNISIKNSLIYGNSSAGILLQSTQNFSIQNNDIYNNNTNNSSEGTGVYLYAASGAFVISNGLITENRFFNTSNQKYPVGVRNDSGSNFTGLTITENTSSGHSTSDGLGTFSGTVASSVTDVYRTAFTDGRVPYRASGRWTDSASLTFDGTDLVGAGRGQFATFTVGTSSVASGIFDVAGQGIIGPKSASSGNGGQLRFRDDTGTSRWLFGHGGSGGATSFLVYDLVNSKLPFTVTTNTPDNALVLGTSSNTMSQSLSVTGNLSYSGGLIATGTPQTLTGAGAVNTTSDTTILVTTGANALTLADGTAGQSKTIVMKTDGGDGTLTPTNLAGATTITFNDAGDTVTLKFIDGKWYIVGSYGVTIA